MSVIARTHHSDGGVAISDGEPPPDRTNILGVGVSAVDMSMAVRKIRRWIAAGARTYVCVTGVHGIMESQRNPRLRDVHNAAGMVTPDGMPLVYISRAWGQRTTARVYGPDLMAAICADSVTAGYTHFLYGATDATLTRLAERLRRRFLDRTLGFDVGGHLQSLGQPNACVALRKSLQTTVLTIAKFPIEPWCLEAEGIDIGVLDAALASFLFGGADDLRAESLSPELLVDPK